MKLRDLIEQNVTEIKMAPGSLSTQAAKLRPTLGFEMEMFVDGNIYDLDEEPDFDYDEKMKTYDDVEDFFLDGPNSSRAVRRFMRSIDQDFEYWKTVQINRDWESAKTDYVREWIVDNTDIKDTEGYDLDYLEDHVEQAISNETHEYNMAHEQYLQDFDDYYTFEDFLSSEDLTMASDIYNRYSGEIEWPRIKKASVFGEVSKTIKNVTGRNATWSEDYHGVARGGDYYIVEPDSSLSSNNSDHGVEIIGPPLPYEQAVREFAKIYNWGQRNCYTDSETGLHINMSFPAFDRAKIDYVKLVILSGDEYVLKQFEREFNSYSRNMTREIKNKAANLTSSAAFDSAYTDQIFNQMRKHFTQITSKYIHTGKTRHIDSINIHDNRVEFRSPGDNWLDKPIEELLAVVNRYTVALSAAMDPDAYRKEYLKKFYKIIKPGNDSTRSLFAQVLAGEINKEEFRAAMTGIIQQRELTQLRSKPQTAPETKPEAPKPGEYSWKVVDSNGRILHRFNSTDADRDNKIRAWASTLNGPMPSEVQVYRDF
jgi:hypothetical protein